MHNANNPRMTPAVALVHALDAHAVETVGALLPELVPRETVQHRATAAFLAGVNPHLRLAHSLALARCLS